MALTGRVCQARSVDRILQYVRSGEAIRGPIVISYPFRGTCPTFRSLGVAPLTGQVLLTCLGRQYVSLRATQGMYERTCFGQGKGGCFTVTFPGVSKKCRVRGECFGTYVTPGSVAYVVDAPRDEVYCVFRKFVSFLSFEPTFPSLRRKSCVILGSIDGLRGTFSFLSQCSNVYYYLSGSATKGGTIRTLGSGCKVHVYSLSRRCSKCGSLGRCLYKGGSRPCVVW